LSAKSLAVVGAGWAGLAAAVRATEAGHRVTLFDMAPQPGGRARAVLHDGVALDNGQHILIGAYRDTLALMRTVGADPGALFDRRPLALLDPQGQGLALPRGPAVPAFVRGVLAQKDWPLSERLALLAAAVRWRLTGFRAGPQQTVDDLVRTLPKRARTTLIEPLCVAALNTPSSQASAQVFLRVLRDALFSGPGAADLLLPRVPLSALLPTPATRWLQQQGAELRWTARVQRIEPAGAKWQVDGELFDAVLLACSAHEAARLAQPVAAIWAQTAAAFDYEPIVTVYLQSPGARLPSPMVALHAGPDAPAQFAFDLGALDPSGARSGLFAFVVSGAKAWVEAGLDATAQATLRQAQCAFGSISWRVLRTIAERRATFMCKPGLARPPTHVAPALAAAGDYIDGPYPATLEGAVRSALTALHTLGLRNP
jgi:hydroxysqualene dehydroxylase